MISRFKIRIKDSSGERWADANKVFAHLIKNYMKSELTGSKPLPYKNKVDSFFRDINEDWVEALCESYPNVDVQQELGFAKAWLLSNTKNAKSDFKKFVNNWMAKSMRNGGKVEAIDGRAEHKRHIAKATPEEDLASPEEIKKMLGIK